MFSFLFSIFSIPHQHNACSKICLVRINLQCIVLLRVNVDLKIFVEDKVNYNINIVG